MAGTSAAKLALARGVGAISRLRGGGGTSAPGKLLMRLAPDAIGDLGARLPRGSVLISATNGKTTTATMAAGVLERAGIALVHNRAGANMAGGIATTLLDAARPGGAIAGELGLFEVDELWLAQLACAAAPARDPARQPVPRPARPLRRARHDRRALGAGAARRRREARAERRRSAARRPRPRAPGGPVLRGRRRLAGAGRDGARRRRQALPPLRRAVRVRRDLPRPPRPLPLPELRPVAAGAGGHGHRRAPAGRARGALHAGHARRARPRSRSRCRGCTTSTTRSPPPRWARALEIPLETIVAGLQATQAAFGRAESVTVSVPALRRRAGAAANGAARRHARELRILLSRTPPAPTRCCARSRSSPASTTCWACSTTTSPTAATSRGSGTPTSSCWPGASGGRRAAARARRTSRRG